MPKLGPIDWLKLVESLRKRGFEGPLYGGKHPYMIKVGLVLTIPNPHRTQISPDLLSRILRQAGISRDEWLSDE